MRKEGINSKSKEIQLWYVVAGPNFEGSGTLLIVRLYNGSLWLLGRMMKVSQSPGGKALSPENSNPQGKCQLDQGGRLCRVSTIGHVSCHKKDMTMSLCHSVGFTYGRNG